METSDNSYLGYNTYILGTARNIIDCLRVVVYNRTKLLSSGRIDKVSIYNLNKVISQLKNLSERGEDCYTEIPRASINDPFRYVERGDGFDTIIYLSNSDSSGIGYTEFITQQGEYRDINIYLLFDSKVNQSVGIRIENSLSQLQNNNSTVDRDWIGDSLYDYVSYSEIKKWDGTPNKSLFTSHTSSLQGPRQSGVWNRTGIITSLKGEDPKLYNIGISKNISVDPYHNEFPKSCIGYYYDGDLAYYSWDGMKYSIYSLCKVNRFGNPTNYTSGGSQGYLEIPRLTQSDEILYFSGRLAIVWRDGKTEYYDTVTKEFISLRTGNYFVDTYDPRSRIRELPKIPYYSNVISSVPEVLSTFFDIKTFSSNSYLNIVRKYGDWFVFADQKNGLKGSKLLYIFSSLTSSLRVSSEELDNVILFNNDIIGVKQDDGSIRVYNSQGEDWYTPKALEIAYPGNKETELNFIHSYQEKEEKEIKKGNIVTITSEEPLWNTWLKKFRRNGIFFYGDQYPKASSVVSAWAGIIFYKLNGYLNYL